ncbi:MAG TPA: hypothetical protein PKA24_20130, partial [Microthrixaceae bacterium]|nr:hypothetical protein [Microthrixaceae bacterium]
MLHSRSKVGADAVLDENFPGQTAGVDEPLSHLTRFGLPEAFGALGDVAVEFLLITASAWRDGPSSGRPILTAPTVGLLAVSSAFSKESHRVASGAAATGEDEVDGRSAVTTAVAAPPLLAAATGEDADR